MKRIVTLLICLFFLTSLGVFAGGANESISTATPVELSWYMAHIVSSVKDYEMVEKALDVVLQKRINATIKLKFTDYGEYVDKINEMIAAGEPMDIVYQGILRIFLSAQGLFPW